MVTSFHAQIVADAPDPEDALRHLERIVTAAEHVWDLTSLTPEAHTILSLCVSRGPYLAKLLARDPHRLLRVAQDPYLRREKPKTTIAADLESLLSQAECVTESQLNSLLRQLRGDEMVRLGVREFQLGTPVEVGRELARLADICLDQAIVFHQNNLRREFGPPQTIGPNGVVSEAQFCVIGMGKLGGEELNFASDIDLVYVHSSDAGKAGDLSLHEYFCRLSERVTSSLGSVTEDDVVFHVDLRLRPEGARGTITNSLASLEQYYESWGHPWERQAWLKARPSAGDSQLGEQTLARLRPFIYPNAISTSVVENVIELNQRIKSQLSSGHIQRGFDVKNGQGGIREIEFFVQALQLVHSGKQPRLRARATRPALEALLFAGLINANEHQQLLDGYEFLRRIEHLLQLDSGRQTQTLPSDEQQLKTIAGRADFADHNAFKETLDTHTKAIANIFATLDDGQQTTTPSAVLGLLGPSLDEERAYQLLEELGFRSLEASFHLLEQTRRRPHSPFSPRASGARGKIASELLTNVGTSPDPDQALRHVCALINRRGPFSELWRLFDANPALMQLIVSLFGASEYLGRRFVEHPGLIDTLVQMGTSPPQLSRARLHADLKQVMANLSLETNEEDFWNRLATFKNTQVLRIGLADIGGVLAVESVAEQLSTLAEVCLQAAFDAVYAVLTHQRGRPRCEHTGNVATMSVLALGKLGGAELGYASDLDLVFVYSADGTADGPGSLDNVTYMTRLAQRLMSGLHALHPGGRLYDVDTRLRPSGSKGLLVSSLTAWNNYHRDHAALWERQALTKLRPVAGDPVLGQNIATTARAHTYHTPPPIGQIAAAVHHMRQRIEHELAGPIPQLNIKTGPGGIIDVEFAAQYLQLAYGITCPQLQTTNTVQALGAAATLKPALAEHCTLLSEGYRFLRHLENRMRIVHDRSVDKLPKDPSDLQILARRVGYPDGPALAEAYSHWTSSIRAAYREILELAD